MTDVGPSDVVKSFVAPGAVNVFAVCAVAVSDVGVLVLAWMMLLYFES